MNIISLLRDNLKLRLDSFINLPDKGFFLGIADYVKYVSENPRFNRIIGKINQERENDELKLNQIESKTNQEIQVIEGEIFELIKNKQLHFAQLEKEIKDYQAFKEGRIQSTSTEIQSYFGYIASIIRAIYESEYKNLVKKYVSIDPESKLITSYLISDSYWKYEEELKHFRSLLKRTVWGSWNELKIVNIVIHQYREQIEQLKESNDFWRRMNLHGLHEEMEDILNNGRAARSITRVHFIKDEYVMHIQKVHTYITEQLLEQEEKELENGEAEKVKDEKLVSNTNEIGDWLEKKDKEVIVKLWKVVRLLNLEWQLRDQNTFKVPVGKFHKLNGEIEGDLEPLIISLHRKKIISVMEKLGETPPPKDNEVKPQMSIWRDIEDYPKMLHGYETQIEIFPSKFTQLYEILQSKMISVEDNVNTYINDGKSMRQIVSSIISALDLPKKEKKFLRILSDGKPHNLKDLAREIPSSAVAHLKKEVVKKLGKNSGIRIITSPRNPNIKAWYQLEKSPQPKSLN